MKEFDSVDLFYYLLVNRMNKNKRKITQRSGTIFFDVVE